MPVRQAELGGRQPAAPVGARRRARARGSPPSPIRTRRRSSARRRPPCPGSRRRTRGRRGPPTGRGGGRRRSSPRRPPAGDPRRPRPPRDPRRAERRARRHPSSAASRFEPSPTATTGMSRSDAHPSASSSSASDSGCANAAAGPPVPIVVSLDNAGRADSHGVMLRELGEAGHDRARGPPGLPHPERHHHVAGPDDAQREVARRRRGWAPRCAASGPEPRRGRGARSRLPSVHRADRRSRSRSRRRRARAPRRAHGGDGAFARRRAGRRSRSGGRRSARAPSRAPPRSSVGLWP